MKYQTVKIKQLIDGIDVLTRIAREEKSGDYKTAYRIAKMQTKVMGIIGPGSPYDFARLQLARQKTVLKRPLRPDGTEGEETRMFAGEADREAFEDELVKLQSVEVQIPIGFLVPADAAQSLKLDKPISGAEMAAAWWLFDAAALEAMEAELEAVG